MFAREAHLAETQLSRASDAICIDRLGVALSLADIYAGMDAVLG